MLLSSENHKILYLLLTFNPRRLEKNPRITRRNKSKITNDGRSFLSRYCGINWPRFLGKNYRVDHNEALEKNFSLNF